MGQPSSEDLLSWLLLAKSVARQAGALILELQRKAKEKEGDGEGEALGIEWKSNPTDLVTRADMASQELIFSRVRDQIGTSHRFIGEEDEEDSVALDERPTWIVDAIDGTTNYVHGLRDFAVSIAISVGKRVQVGVVYAPAHDEMFVAARGHGAYLNDAALRRLDNDSHKGVCALADALIVSEWGYLRTPSGVDTMLAANRRLLVAQTRGIRQLGSGALDMCYVAAARVDAVYCGIAEGDAWNIWDYAAASLIAEEAGAVLRTVDGRPFHIEEESMVCAAPGVIDELLAAITG